MPPLEAASATPTTAAPSAATTASSSASSALPSAAPLDAGSAAVDVFGLPVDASGGDATDVGGMQTFSSRASVVLERGKRRRLDVTVAARCDGDCAIGPGTYVSLLLEQSDRAMQACFPEPADATVVLQTSLSRIGRSVDARLVDVRGRRADAQCLLGVVRATSMPPGSGPHAQLTLRYDIKKR
jgi:hypothetical protein